MGQGFERAVPLVTETLIGALEAAAREVGQVMDPEASRASLPVVLPPLLIESGAGSGATLGGTLEELAVLLATLPPRAGLCFDTAHLFAAGYPVHEVEGLESVIADAERLGLLSKVGLIHLNDSGSPFASRRDRHVNPGEGEIGVRGLARVVRHPALAHVPFVLEVPGPEKRGPSAAEIAVVKTMRKSAPSRRRAPAPGASPPEGPA